uniref:Uncharacterized protein n=1 Tax=Kalanchoe fedtschenkoi TaxID=63787 RepID=A0A7N0ZXM1_KALFE
MMPIMLRNSTNNQNQVSCGCMTLNQCRPIRIPPEVKWRMRMIPHKKILLNKRNQSRSLEYLHFSPSVRKFTNEAYPHAQQKTTKTSGPGNKSEIRYRQLYVESRKKLEELTRANNELSLKLAVAEGKLEVYEKGSGIISSIIGKTKDAIMASALSKATEQLLAHTTSPIKPNKNLRAPVAKKKPVANLGKK